MRLPQARGPLSDQLLRALAGGKEVDVDNATALLEQRLVEHDVLTDDDVHLTLWAGYELHYRGFDDVAAAREWDPGLIELRRRVEAHFETALRTATADRVSGSLEATGDFATRLLALIARADDDAPPLAAHLQRTATTEQFLDFMIQRSVYHLRESDPHTFVLPRIDGAPKAALAELQYDEYGGGRADRLHATLFGDALEGCGLDRSYGAYVDRATGHTLATNNVMSLFGLQRRFRGAALGHLAAFEATSSVPCRKIAGGLERVGLPDVVAAYFHEHVEADAVHEQLAAREICGALVTAEPALAEDVLFGAAACLHLDALAAEAQLREWDQPRMPEDVTEEAS